MLDPDVHTDDQRTSFFRLTCNIFFAGFNPPPGGSGAPGGDVTAQDQEKVTVTLCECKSTT